MTLCVWMQARDAWGGSMEKEVIAVSLPCCLPCYGWTRKTCALHPLLGWSQDRGVIIYSFKQVSQQQLLQGLQQKYSPRWEAKWVFQVDFPYILLLCSMSVSPVRCWLAPLRTVSLCPLPLSEEPAQNYTCGDGGRQKLCICTWFKA